MSIRRAVPADAEPAAARVRPDAETGVAGSCLRGETLSGVLAASGIGPEGLLDHEEHRRHGLLAAASLTAGTVEWSLPERSETAVGSEESPGARSLEGCATHRGQRGHPAA